MKVGMRIQKMSVRQHYVLLLFGLAVLLIALLFGTTMPSVLWISVPIIFSICGVGVIVYWKKPIQDETVRSDSSQVTVYIFAGLYGIIAGFAIKNAIGSTITDIIDKIALTNGDSVSTQFSQIITNLGQSNYEITMFLVFLVTAIPFYHCAIVITEISKS